MSDIIMEARALRDEMTSALQTMFEALNQGQRKKLLKDEAVAALLVRYGVIETEQAEEVSE